MKHKQNTQQQGSLLIEMIAVIGLLALVTPILFMQVQRRNEEIINTQVASEMRMLKDGVSAYIQATEDVLASDCHLIDSNGKYKNVATATNFCFEAEVSTVIDFLPGPVSGNLNADYNIYYYGYTVPQNCVAEGEGTVCDDYRPVIYAVIAQSEARQNLRQAAKIAALIGLEGGVVVGQSGASTIAGMQGAWGLPNQGGKIQQDAVVAITSFDNASNASILKDVEWQHLKSDTAQADTMATERLGVKQILTVDSTENCIANYKNNTVQIKSSSTTSTCTPFFEVDPTTKKVTLKGIIGTGKTSGGTCASFTDRKNCENAVNCVWANDICTNEYLLNPAETSLVSDIKISARGGAKLSEILPKWILKNVRHIFGSSASFTAGNCPTGYRYAITASPMAFYHDATAASTISVEGKTEMKDTKDITVTTTGATEILVHEYCVYTGS